MVKIKERIKKLNRLPRAAGSRIEYVRADKNESMSCWDKEALSSIYGSIQPEELSMYPEPSRLYEKLSKWLDVKESMVLLTNGSDGGIKSAFEIFVEQGSRVVVFSPTYAMYDVYIQIFGAKKVNIGFKADFSSDNEKLIKIISNRIGLIALANPNSPTGTVLEPDFLQDVIVRAHRYGVPILIDEAYFHFYPHSMLKNILKYNNLMVLRTFSKALGVASIRLGYVIACPRIINAFYKVRPMYEANTFALKAAEYIIDHPKRISNYIKMESDGKKRLVSGLRDLGLEVEQGQANFVLVKLCGKRKKIYDYLKSKGILVYLPAENSFLSDYCRITTGPRDKMEKILSIIDAYLRR